jgi:glycosyltransferase involved in cell wall biosynthesis
MKPLIVVQGPVATRSGYGNHTRDLVTALIKADKYDIQIISLPWGSTPMTALEKHNTDHEEILKRIARAGVNQQPDVFIQISVPNEFCIDHTGKAFKPGKFNIGITAGIETTHVSPEFIQGCNRMDLVITTSEHSKKSFINSVFDTIDEKTKQKKGNLKVESPMEVLFEGADLNTYKKTSDIHESVKAEFSEIKDDFCFLFVGHWLKGEIGQDRKDVGMMIKTFCETFKRKSKKNRPGLILKTSHAHFSIIDRDVIIQRIQSVIQPYGENAPNIYLLHGDLTDKEMNSLYNHPKVKAMVSFTKGEGFGRPLMEFGLTGKPIIASGWSGHLDFLKPERTVLLPGQLTQVHPSAVDKFILKESNWFTVEYSYASKVLVDVMDNYKKYLELSRKQPQYVKDNFSLDKMSEIFVKLVDKGLQNVPQQVGLTLPKLKKAAQETPKLKLPKLKKVEA